MVGEAVFGTHEYGGTHRFLILHFLAHRSTVRQSVDRRSPGSRLSGRQHSNCYIICHSDLQPRNTDKEHDPIDLQTKNILYHDEDYTYTRVYVYLYDRTLTSMCRPDNIGLSKGYVTEPAGRVCSS